MTDYDGSTVNGRPILTIEDVKSWMPMSDRAAARVAHGLGKRALEAPFWEESLVSNPNVQRLRRIRDGLKALTDDLRQLLDLQLIVRGKTSLDIEQFLGQAIAITPRFRIDGLLPAGPGAPPDRALEFAQELYRVLEEIHQEENPGKRLYKKKLDGFVSKAAAWLGIDASDSAVARQRNRKKERPGQ